MENLNTATTGKKYNRIRNAAIISSMILLLSSCLSKEEKYQRQVQKVQELEYKLKQQSDNYNQVAHQQNIQQDLKEGGADATINQEIGYSLDRALDQDEEIAKTKKELSKAQKKLAEMNEEMANYRQEQKINRQIQEERLNTRLNPNKYEYIKEEYKRSRSN